MTGAYIFFREFLRSPLRVASLVPSSSQLKAKIVAAAGIPEARTIVELGPGTGGTTRAILAAMRPEARLLTVEIIPRFNDMLREIQDNRLSVCSGNAEELDRHLETHGVEAPDAVVSGIPFSRVPETVGTRIVMAIAGALPPRGRFVAYQLSPRVDELARPVLGEARVDRAWLNLPPIRVYCWIKGPA